MIRIPTEEAFITGTTAPPIPGRQGVPIFADFIAAPELREIADRLIRTGPVSRLNDGKLRIDYRWKHRGGFGGGRANIGKCVKLSGAAKHYAGGAHFLIWLAADHCETEGYDARQIEALLFHELLQIEPEEKEDKFGNPVTVYHKVWMDFDGFFAELEHYGAWNRNLQRLDEVVRQMALPGFDADERSDDVVANSPRVQAAARRLVTDTMRPGSGIDSITFSTPQTGESVTITREDAERLRAAPVVGG